VADVDADEVVATGSRVESTFAVDDAVDVTFAGEDAVDAEEGAP
jgi:hypothetical protein